MTAEDYRSAIDQLSKKLKADKEEREEERKEWEHERWGLESELRDRDDTIRELQRKLDEVLCPWPGGWPGGSPE